MTGASKDMSVAGASKDMSVAGIEARQHKHQVHNSSLWEIHEAVVHE